MTGAPGGAPPQWREVPTLGQAVADFLAAEILRGRWPDGHRLPETQIAEETGTSRGPVRDALRILAAQGFVTLRPRSSVVIHAVTTTMITELYQLRSILEGWICRQTVPLLGAEDIDAVRGLHREMASLLERQDYPSFYDTAWQLRQLLYAKCPNGLVLREVETIRTRLRSLPSLAWSQEGKAREDFGTYTELIAAAEGGRAEEAGRLVSGLLLRTGDEVASYFEELRAGGARNDEGRPGAG